MKIHQLQFKNINNLKGEHTINFEEIPLASAGIFAIVGPTGSGKPTILDVITLALFNRIPRFKKAISKNEITSEGSVLTHHTTEASASIVYEIKGKKYTSSWSVSKNRNGNLKDYEMTFYYPDGSVADFKRSEVPTKNEEIIGLKYKQFIKSILLSQGEFAKFLKADKNERGELLENITGTSIYRRIGLKTYSKFKEVREALKTEKEKIEVIETLGEEERKELEKESKRVKKEKEKLDTILIASNKLKQLKSDIDSISSKLDQKIKEEKVVRNKVLAFKVYQVKLDIHQKLAPVQGQLTRYNDAVANAQKNQENLKEYELSLTKAIEDRKKTIDDMSKLVKVEVSELSFKKIMNDFETEINNADRDLENLKSNGAAARERINQKLLTYAIPFDDSVSPKKAIAMLDRRAKELKVLIAEAKLNSSEPLAEIKKKLKKSQSEVEILKSVEVCYKELEELQFKLKSQKEELQKFIETEKSKTPLLKKCTELIDSFNQQIELFQKQKEDAIKIAELEEFRDALVFGDPCPLCGSKEHPYLEDKPEIQKNEIDQKVNKAKKALEEQKEERDLLIKELTQCVTSKELILKRISELSVEMSNADKEVEKVIATFTGQSSISKEKISQSIKVLSDYNDKTKEALEAVVENKTNKELTAQYRELEEQLDSYKVLKKNRDSKFDGSDVSVITNELQDTFEISKSKITELTAVIEKESNSLKSNSELATSIANELESKIKELGFSDIKDISNNVLEEDIYDDLTEKLKRLNREETSIEPV